MTEEWLPETYRTVGYDPRIGGCSYEGCASQDTATVDGINGRRCASHPPQPPWIAHADAGRFSEAFRALRAHLATRARWSA